MCLATQDDITDKSTDCYKSCVTASGTLLDSFNPNTYTGGNFNTGDFINTFNVFLIKLMTTFDDCTYTNYMLMTNNRLNDWSFIGGMGANLVTQLAMYPLDVQSPIYVAYNDIFEGF